MAQKSSHQPAAQDKHIQNQPGGQLHKAENRGFDCEFVELPPDLFQSECPVCLQIIREPYQVTCCGYSFCRSCIEEIKTDNRSCPTCTNKGFSEFPNKGLKRSLYAFKVRCSHQKDGCKWTGELGQFDVHLNKDPLPEKRLDGCSLTNISCDFANLGCEVNLTRKDLPEHMRKNLLAHTSLLAVSQANLASCNAKQQAQIINLVAENGSLRRNADKLCVEINNLKESHALLLASHTGLQTDCSELKGENQRLNRELTALSQAVTTKGATAVDVPVTVAQRAIVPLVPSDVLIMTDFKQHKKDKGDCYLPSIYTHYQGYKICLRVVAYGQLAGKGTHISVFVHFMRGEFDDFLQWPFRGTISLRLLDQLSGVHHKVYTSIYDDSRQMDVCNRALYGERAAKGYGSVLFLAHTELEPKYLRNNTLKFQVHSGEIHV